ncbi:MAG: hypothetical protein IPG50_11355 [Myxococcales bacterium]|nr:hypothetical protein [Myxococcales bacterium]
MEFPLLGDFRVRTDGHVLLIGTIEHQPLDLTVGHFSGQDWHSFFAEVDTTGAFQALLPVRGSVTALVERPNGSVVLGGFADWLSGPSPGPLVVGDESSMPPAADKNGFLLMRNP